MAGHAVRLQNGISVNCEVHNGILPFDTLFIHGNMASNRWFYPTLEILRERARPHYKGRMILAEWRGCGGTTAPKDKSELQPDVLAQDYLQLLDQLDVKQAGLVGHSTGGLIALMAMAERPQVFSRTVLLDSVGATGVRFTKEAFAAFQQMSEDRGICAAILGSTIYGNDPSSLFFQELVDDAFHMSPLIWLGIPRTLNEIDVHEKIKNIPVPTLILRGEFDQVISRESSEELAAILPQGRYQELPNHGHCLNVEDPAKFVSLLNEFLFQQSL
jgi:3-oxoadipate enol-lactonase